MKVHLLSAYPGPPVDPNNFAFLWLRESAAADPFRRHQVTDDPESADIILFVENHPGLDPYLLGVRSHPLFRRHRRKCFLYHDADIALPISRGVYPSIRRRDFQPDRCRSYGYIARLVHNSAIRYDPEPVERHWLYTFFGEANSAVRKAIFARAHPDGLVRDTTGHRLWELRGDAFAAFTRDYADAILKSRFVLCPAGLGPTSYRLFETMEMGRVPVILSDEWLPPIGPDWESFSLRLPEDRVGELSALLIPHAARCEAMGRAARQAWEDWFAKPVCFHRLVELCAELLATPASPFSALRPWWSLVRPPHAQNLLRPRYRSLTARLRR